MGKVPTFAVAGTFPSERFLGSVLVSFRSKQHLSSDKLTGGLKHFFPILFLGGWYEQQHFYGKTSHQAVRIPEAHFQSQPSVVVAHRSPLGVAGVPPSVATVRGTAGPEPLAMRLGWTNFSARFLCLAGFVTIIFFWSKDWSIWLSCWRVSHPSNLNSQDPSGVWEGFRRDSAHGSAWATETSVDLGAGPRPKHGRLAFFGPFFPFVPWEKKKVWDFDRAVWTFKKHSYRINNKGEDRGFPRCSFFFVQKVATVDGQCIWPQPGGKWYTVFLLQCVEWFSRCLAQIWISQMDLDTCYFQFVCSHSSRGHASDHAQLSPECLRW